MKKLVRFNSSNRSDRIFCLIVEGEPNTSELAGRALEECFAPALRRTLSDELPTPQHGAPIAADVRPHKDGKTNAKLKLIAGIIGVGLDALKQREHQRHVRRMAALTALSLVVMCITTGLAIEAAIARRTAEFARQAAERRQKQAENLVEFMLGDLHDKLNEVQRLDILEATNNEAMKYFQSLPTNDVTDQALALRAKALQHIGSIRASQGKLPAALEAYRTALALARELADRAPTDSARRVAYANCFNWIGNAYWFQGDLDSSLRRKFQKAIGVLETEATARPNDAELAANLASARTNAGRVYEARGDFQVAKRLYDQVQLGFESLAKRDPGNTRWQSELGYAYDNLGKVALEQSQLTQAIEAYRDDQRIKAALAAQDPKNYDAQEALLVADAILGRALALVGATNASLGYVRESVNISKTLVAFDPTQAYWREDLASYSRLLSSTLRQNGELNEAIRLNAEALANNG